MFADTQLDEAFWRLRSSPSSTTLLLYYSLPNQPGHVCPAEFWNKQHYVLNYNASLYRGHFSDEVTQGLDISVIGNHRHTAPRSRGGQKNISRNVFSF